MANPNGNCALDQDTVVEHVNHVNDAVKASPDQSAPVVHPPSNPYLTANIPESARTFFASVSSPTDICPQSSSLGYKELTLSQTRTSAGVRYTVIGPRYLRS